ncbi:efflux RND transporter periplasmic adaptor subunit [Ferrimonas sp. SCSIO 43195]|uniref:efflux RND transporter periplasmic adaptor subunit n=1 Tax=Ferrimonas sp. SCSIO 43195 TaxID=2822844 RepID=UPI002076577F|nr:efflux RND transporter periplasmic adaptor subunit [Ferrimonas sp. SCSIO 43195]USD38797.1 efflux RND transporter periplasmic adaptor subunit [Ferrimonas sp. SCSIO 43195]
MTKLRRWGGTLLISTLLITPFAAYKAFEIRSAMAMVEHFPEHSETVTSATAHTVQHQPQLTVMGEVVMPEHLVISNELAGRVGQIAVKPGQQVEKGQLLLLLEISEELARQRSARAKLKHTKLKLERIRALKKTQAASQSQQDELIAELEIAEAELDLLQSTIDKKTLRAPFAGTVGLFQLEPGSYLNANTQIGTLSGTQPWTWVEFELPQFYSKLPLGAEVTISGQYQNAPPMTATVIASDTTINTNTRTQRYRSRLPEKHDLTHNQAVRVIAPNGAPRSLQQVPLEAVQRDAYGNFVYLLNHSEAEPDAIRAQRQPVTLYRQFEHYALLSQGLSGGEQLAANGAFKLYPGVLVNIAPPSPQPEIGSQLSQHEE